jgi:DNA repair photolyase
MSIIYEPTGKAKEYADLAANFYTGCEHGCLYCYAPTILKIKRNCFIKPVPRKNITDLFEKDAKKFSNDKRNILFSFTSDCYQPIESDKKITRLALHAAKRFNLNITILTKGGLLATRDFDLLQQNKKNRFAVTLTTDNKQESIKWEPKAAFPDDRIESLKIAKQACIKTWVSFEPVFNTKAVLRLIDKTHSFVDFYKVGKINYHPIGKKINWTQFLIDVEKKLKQYNKQYYIKKDLEFFRRQ